MEKEALTLHYEINLPTLNEYIDAERTNKILASKAKRKFTQYIMLETIAQCKAKLSGMHDVDVTWYRNNKKHDADNVYFGIKFILDGIVAAKVIPGDDRKVIRDISHHIRHDEKNSILLTFTRVK